MVPFQFRKRIGIAKGVSLNLSKRGAGVFTLILIQISFVPAPMTYAFSLGCSNAQAEAQEFGAAASASIQSETYYVDRSYYTEAFQAYLRANKSTNEWRKVVLKSPKCFKDQRRVIEPIFKKFYSKASMCERYGSAICRSYPSKLPPRKPTTLADICGKNPYSASYLDCVERLGEPDWADYAD